MISARACGMPRFASHRSCRLLYPHQATMGRPWTSNGPRTGPAACCISCRPDPGPWCTKGARIAFIIVGHRPKYSILAPFFPLSSSLNYRISTEACTAHLIVSFHAQFIYLAIGINHNLEGAIGAQAVCGNIE